MFIVGGALLWYLDRPKPPKPWDNRAVTAEYDYVDTEGDKNNIEVFYTLQNNTNFDFEIHSADQVQLAGKLGRENSISIAEPGEQFLTGNFPVFVPAHGRTRFGVRIQYPYTEKYDRKASEDVRYDFGTKLAKFMSDEFANLDGFVLLDESHRYRIEFPSSWKARAKEPLRVKREVIK